tara:strand:+ start:405 stop:653 length:249 start_codon:yes stop_codon:yes gene_type:complete
MDSFRHPRCWPPRPSRWLDVSAAVVRQIRKTRCPRTASDPESTGWSSQRRSRSSLTTVQSSLVMNISKERLMAILAEFERWI